MTRNISEERGSQFTPWRKTVITHSTCSLRPKRALLRHISSVPYVQGVHCYVTSYFSFIQSVHYYVTFCLYLTSKACIVTSHLVCSLRPNRALLRDILSVPYVQTVHCCVTSCLYLSPNHALLRDVLSVPYVQIVHC